MALPVLAPIIKTVFGLVIHRKGASRALCAFKGDGLGRLREELRED
jgi:hypothetical protein